MVFRKTVGGDTTGQYNAFTDQPYGAVTHKGGGNTHTTYRTLTSRGRVLPLGCTELLDPTLLPVLCVSLAVGALDPPAAWEASSPLVKGLQSHISLDDLCGCIMSIAREIVSFAVIVVFLDALTRELLDVPKPPQHSRDMVHQNMHVGCNMLFLVSLELSSKLQEVSHPLLGLWSTVTDMEHKYINVHTCVWYSSISSGAGDHEVTTLYRL